MSSRTTEPTLENLLSRVHKRTSRAQRNYIKKAYYLAEDAHKFQERLSGEPYIIHPTAVAIEVAELELDYEAICAALMHDVLEDTETTFAFLAEEFGDTIARLVDGVTKISQLKTGSVETKQATNIRKMILATAEDARVILIKLADKLHNMRTLQHHPTVEKRQRIAKEVLDIYAPLAGRLGIYRIKWELEDMALYNIDHEAYQKIKQTIAEKKGDRNKRIQAIVKILQQKMKESRIKALVEGRAKHFYSIYNKLHEQNKSIDEIYDLSGVRILVDSIQDCYGAMGIVHTLWNPVPGRFKDYISVPKSNGYQSLHTTVVGNDGRFIEIQIRTRQMNLVAEFGIAAHWAYKEKKKNSQELTEQFELLQNIANLRESGQDATEFMEELKGSLTTDEIFVFTPQGEIIAMPTGSTILDFAFRIHTELGLKCAGAKIEDRMVSIRTPLKSGDQVQIITNASVKPSSEWLKFLATSHARAKLRSWFRKNDLETVADKDKSKGSVKEPGNQEDAEKKLTLVSKKITKRKDHTDETPLVEWQGETAMEYHLAKCCDPLPGDAIRGFITTGKGLSVHKADCPSLQNLSESEETRNRIIELNWSGLYRSYPVHINIQGLDRPQIYLEIVQTLASLGANIIEAKAQTTTRGIIDDFFTIEVDSISHLDDIINSLRNVDGVTSVKRFLHHKKESG